jgi:hypothetical protein
VVVSPYPVNTIERKITMEYDNLTSEQLKGLLSPELDRIVRDCQSYLMTARDRKPESLSEDEKALMKTRREILKEALSILNKRYYYYRNKGSK